jgi:hypothetical protein
MLVHSVGCNSWMESSVDPSVGGKVYGEATEPVSSFVMLVFDGVESGVAVVFGGDLQNFYSGVVFG